MRAGAVQVIEEFAASLDAAGQAKVAGADDKLFIYLAWHNTHTPLECPEEWMFPPLASWHNNNSQRNTYNCMARVLDDGIGNVTKALRAAQLWDDTLMLFSVKVPTARTSLTALRLSELSGSQSCGAIQLLRDFPRLQQEGET